MHAEKQIELTDGGAGRGRGRGQGHKQQQELDEHVVEVEKRKHRDAPVPLISLISFFFLRQGGWSWLRQGFSKNAKGSAEQRVWCVFVL
jgi:hypothetical protein